MAYCVDTRWTLSSQEDTNVAYYRKPGERFLIRKYKMADKKGALDSLAKIKGMFAPDRVEIINSALTRTLKDLSPAAKAMILERVKRL